MKTKDEEVRRVSVIRSSWPGRRGEINGFEEGQRSGNVNDDEDGPCDRRSGNGPKTEY